MHSLPRIRGRAALGFAALSAAICGCVSNATTLRTCERTDGGGQTEIYDCVAIVGRLIEFREEEGETNAYVIPGANYAITARNGDGLVGGQTGSDGVFVADGIETNATVAMSFLKTGFAPAVFSGETGERDSFLYTGSVHLDTLEVAQDYIDEYSTAVLGTSGTLMTLSSGGGAIVRGRVQHFVELSDDGVPVFEDVAGATVEVLDAGGNPYAVYYRGTEDADEDEILDVDPDATATGENASFAAFAVSATSASPIFGGRTIGGITVRVTFDGVTADEQTYAIDGGIAEFRPFIAP